MIECYFNKLKKGFQIQSNNVIMLKKNGDGMEIYEITNIYNNLKLRIDELWRSL